MITQVNTIQNKTEAGTITKDDMTSVNELDHIITTYMIQYSLSTFGNSSYPPCDTTTTPLIMSIRYLNARRNTLSSPS